MGTETDFLWGPEQDALAALMRWDVGGLAHMSAPHFLSGGPVWEAVN